MKTENADRYCAVSLTLTGVRRTAPLLRCLMSQDVAMLTIYIILLYITIVRMRPKCVILQHLRFKA